VHLRQSSRDALFNIWTHDDDDDFDDVDDNEISVAMGVPERIRRSDQISQRYVRNAIPRAGFLQRRVHQLQENEPESHPFVQDRHKRQQYDTMVHH
jgi:hypothetical protein